MKTVTFSASEKKINLILKAAKELGVKPEVYELTDEEMGLPGPKVSNEQLENWLMKDDGGEGYTAAQIIEEFETKMKKKRKS